MNVKSVEKHEHSAVELFIEVSKEEFEAAIEQVYRKKKGNINVPGFRKGKAPRYIIEGMFGSGVFYDDAMQEVYPTAYTQAIEQESLDVVSHPSVEIVNVGGDGFSFKATVTIRPTATIKNYKGLVGYEKEVELKDEDIDSQLRPFIERATRIETVERPAQNGDIAVIDFEGTRNGVPFEGGKGETQELELGSHSFIPGFEEQVVGMSAGEEKDIDVTFPENYHTEALSGKQAVFHVKLHEVKEKIPPVLDDEFAKDVSEFDTLEELKKDLAQKLEGHVQKQITDEFEQDLMNELITQIEADIPDPMVEFQMDKMVDDFETNISDKGISLEDYLKMLNMSREDFREKARDPAIRHIKEGLALEAVAAAEGIEIAEAEVEKEFSRLSHEFNIEIAQIKKLISIIDLKRDLIHQKALKVVSENAKIEKGINPAKLVAKEKSAEEKAAEPDGAESMAAADAVEMQKEHAGNDNG